MCIAVGTSFQRVCVLDCYPYTLFRVRIDAGPVLLKP